jgi:hypothetical protein
MGFHSLEALGVRDKKKKTRITELATWSEFKLQIVRHKVFAHTLWVVKRVEETTFLPCGVLDVSGAFNEADANRSIPGMTIPLIAYGRIT